MDGMSHSRRGKRLFSGDVQLHRSPSDYCAQIRAQRLVQDVLLIAESAADVWLDNAHLSPGDSQRLPDDTPADMGDLRG